MNKHTAEPWVVERAHDIDAIAWIGQFAVLPADHATKIGRGNTGDDARRIVACVNACRGLPTDELEQKGLVAAVGTQLLAADERSEGQEREIRKLARTTADAENNLADALNQRDELLEQIGQLKAKLEAAKRSWPDKCPITRRDFFMEIDGVPTYGGPYDSYTIPEMLGTPDQPWHDRGLFVRRFDHDRGHWVDDEIIDLRVIYDEVLDELLADQVAVPAVPKGWKLVPMEPTPEMLDAYFSGTMMQQSVPIQERARERVAKDYRAMLAAAPKPELGDQFSSDQPSISAEQEDSTK